MKQITQAQKNWKLIVNTMYEKYQKFNDEFDQQRHDPKIQDDFQKLFLELQPKELSKKEKKILEIYSNIKEFSSELKANDTRKMLLKILEIILQSQRGLGLSQLFYDADTLIKHIELVAVGHSFFDEIISLALNGNQDALDMVTTMTPEFIIRNRELSSIFYKEVIPYAIYLQRLSPELQDKELELLMIELQSNKDTMLTKVIDPISDFYLILQGKVTNLLPTIQTKNQKAGGQRNVSISKSNYKFTIKEYDELKNGIPTYVYQFFDCLLLHFTSTGSKSAQIRLPLKDYMEMRGLKNIKEARQNVLDSMSILKKIEYNVFENTRGKKPKWSGTISLFGGTGIIRNGIIQFNFNEDFYKTLCQYHTMEVSYQALQLNTHKNPNSYHFLKYISLNYRINEGKQRQNTITIRALTEKSPALPSFDDVAQSDRAFNRRIVQATFRDLDILQSISYTVVSADDDDITDKKYDLSYEDFITSKIVIDYSAWPTHTDRIETRKQYLKTAGEIKDKEIGGVSDSKKGGIGQQANPRSRTIYRYFGSQNP